MVYTRDDIEIRSGSPDLNAEGVFGNNTAIDFTTTTSGIKIKVPDNLDMTVLTIIFWAYTHANIGSFMNIIGWNQFSTNNYYPAIRMLYHSSLMGWVLDGDILSLQYSASKILKWNHYCITRNKTKLELYINGTLVKSDTISNNARANTVTEGYIDIGCPGYYDKEHYVGKVDDLMIARSIVIDHNFDIPDRPVKLLYPNVDWLIDLSSSGGATTNKNNILKIY